MLIKNENPNICSTGGKGLNMKIFKCQLEQISVIFSHLKLWVAVAGHNFKWVKIQIIKLGRIRVEISHSYCLLFAIIYEQAVPLTKFEKHMGNNQRTVN